jgi:hypothetical protein
MGELDVNTWSDFEVGERVTWKEEGYDRWGTVEGADEEFELLRVRPESGRGTELLLPSGVSKAPLSG